jgi:hypothetical protein
MSLLSFSLQLNAVLIGILLALYFDIVSSLPFRRSVPTNDQRILAPRSSQAAGLHGGRQSQSPTPSYRFSSLPPDITDATQQITSTFTQPSQPLFKTGVEPALKTPVSKLFSEVSFGADFVPVPALQPEEKITVPRARYFEQIVNPDSDEDDLQIIDSSSKSYYVYTREQLLKRQLLDSRRGLRHGSLNCTQFEQIFAAEKTEERVGGPPHMPVFRVSYKDWAVHCSNKKEGSRVLRGLVHGATCSREERFEIPLSVTIVSAPSQTASSS